MMTMGITFVFLVVGLGGIVRGASLVSPEAGWLAFGLSMLVLAVWPFIRQRLLRSAGEIQ